VRKIISILVLILIVIISIYFIRDNLDEFNNIPKVSFSYIIPMTILVILTVFVNGLGIKVFGKYYDIKLGINEWFGLSSITAMGNYMTPFRGGVAARAVYLKKVYNLPYTSFLTTIAASYIVRFFVYGLFGILLSFIIFKSYNFFNKTIISVFFVIIIISFIALIIPPTFGKTKYKYLNYIIKVVNEWNIMRKNYSFLFKVLLFDTVVWILASLRLYLAFKSFSFEVPFLFVLLISILFMLAFFLSITPAGLGIVEAVIAFSAEAIGAGFLPGIYAGILDRIISTIVVFVLGSIFSYTLMKGNFKPEKLE